MFWFDIRWIISAGVGYGDAPAWRMDLDDIDCDENQRLLALAMAWPKG
jgi:hypothetical protein